MNIENIHQGPDGDIEDYYAPKIEGGADKENISGTIEKTTSGNVEDLISKAIAKGNPVFATERTKKERDQMIEKILSFDLSRRQLRDVLLAADEETKLHDRIQKRIEEIDAKKDHIA